MKHQKDELRKEILQATQDFLNRGGQITVVPRGLGKDVVKLKRSPTRNKFIYEENTFNYDSAYHRKS